MNYYNPYFYTIPYIKRPSLFNRLSFSKILNSTERALNFANQAIPLVKQIKPITQNARTMFKIMNEFKKNENITKNSNINANGPKFFA